MNSSLKNDAIEVIRGAYKGSIFRRKRAIHRAMMQKIFGKKCKKKQHIYSTSLLNYALIEQLFYFVCNFENDDNMKILINLVSSNKILLDYLKEITEYYVLNYEKNKIQLAINKKQDEILCYFISWGNKSFAINLFNIKCDRSLPQIIRRRADKALRRVKFGRYLLENHGIIM